MKHVCIIYIYFKLTLDERKTLTKVSMRKTSHNHSPKQAQASDMKEQENQQTANKAKASCIARGEKPVLSCLHKQVLSSLHNWLKLFAQLLLTI